MAMNMSNVFQKLNLKNHQEIVVVNAPDTFEREIAGLQGVSVIRDLKAVREIRFALAFVTNQKEIDSYAAAIEKRVQGDAVVWFAYPKQTSKKFKFEIHRDNGWKVLGELGFESVRMVAVDDDWSAKRYRRAEYIKVLTRDKSWVMSKTGKEKAAKK